MLEDNICHEYIIRYLRGLLPPRKGVAGETEARARAAGVPVSQPETMKFLEVLIRAARVQNLLEIGSAVGFSAICMAQAGCTHIDTIELSPEAAAEARTNIERAGLSRVICLHQGDARDLLPQMQGNYDMIFVDAAKGQYHVFFPHCMRMLKPGGLLVSDNVLYKGMTATDELVQHRKITIVKRLRSYLTVLSSSPELETSVLPLGDGVAVSYKLPNSPDSSK